MSSPADRPLFPEEFTFLGHVYQTRQLVRLVLIAGGYVLLRPYLLKLAERFQEREHQRDVSANEESSPAATGVRVDASDDTDDDEDRGWGAAARRRERESRRREEERLKAEDSDEELEAMLNG